MEEAKRMLKQIETLPLKQLLKRKRAELKRKNIYIRYKDNYFMATKYIVGEDFSFADIVPISKELYINKILNNCEYYNLDLFK